jgi:SRSO17 transposase
VQRQYTGSAGKITNCQIGVFAAYVSRACPQLSQMTAAARWIAVTGHEA